MIGDSHARDLGTILTNLTDDETKCFANCIPGGTSDMVARNLNSHVTHLRPSDTLVYLVGTNDIYSSKTGPSISLANEPKKNILSHAKHTNVIMANVPYRLDKKELNESVDTYNDNLLKIAEDFKCSSRYSERVSFLDFNSIMTDDLYKKDGIHANLEGKYALCYEITKMIN